MSGESTGQRMTGCTCTPKRRDWRDDGTCASCTNTVHENQIMDVIKAVLISDPACLLWRNEIGLVTHWPDGKKRKAPIKYGVCNPGGADLLGLYGSTFLAIECKTIRGRQTPEQIEFERAVTARRGIYAVVRSENEARALLQRLRSNNT